MLSTHCATVLHPQPPLFLSSLPHLFPWFSFDKVYYVAQAGLELVFLQLQPPNTEIMSVHTHAWLPKS